LSLESPETGGDPTPDSRAERLRGLGDAIDAFLEFRDRDTPESAEEMLARDPQVRDRLVLFAEGAASLADETQGVPRRIGAYRLIRQLGSGGQGQVWLAEDTRLRRRVALKLLRPEALASPDARARLQREAEVLSRLDHPGICTIYESGTSDEDPWLAMRWVEGPSLAQLLGRATRLPGRAEVLEAAHIVEQAARALHAAHEAGVVHRDLKPANLLIGKDGRPVLVDFGLARPEAGSGSTLTRTGERLGTSAYQAPELIAAARPTPDPKSDVYSLGVTLYEALTLQRPYEGATSLSLERSIQEGGAPDGRRLNRAISRDLAIVVATAMDQDRSRRYASAHDFAEDLRRAREHEPIRARPAGPVLRLRRRIRRSPVLATAAGGLLVTLTSGLLISQRLLREVRDERDEKGRLLHVAETAQRRADQGFTKAMEALERMLSRVMGGSAADPERRKLIGKARDFCRGFLRDHGDDARLHPLVASAYRWLAESHRQLEDWDAWERDLREGLVMTSHFVSDDARTLLGRATLHGQYADLCARAGRIDEAGGHQAIAEALCNRLLARGRRDADLLRQRARLDGTLAEELRGQGRLAAAESHERRAALTAALLGPEDPCRAPARGD